MEIILRLDTVARKFEVPGLHSSARLDLMQVLKTSFQKLPVTIGSFEVSRASLSCHIRVLRAGSFDSSPRIGWASVSDHRGSKHSEYSSNPQVNIKLKPGGLSKTDRQIKRPRDRPDEAQGST